LPFLGIQRQVQNLRDVLELLGQVVGIADAVGQVPGVNALELLDAYQRLHFGHTVVEAHHLVNVGQLGLKLQQAHPLLNVIAVVPE